jgi:hypothetical protein
MEFTATVLDASEFIPEDHLLSKDGFDNKQMISKFPRLKE